MNSISYLSESMNDRIVEEVRRVCEAYAARFGDYLAAMFRDIQEREQASGRRVVAPPPKSESEKLARARRVERLLGQIRMLRDDIPRKTRAEMVQLLEGAAEP
jgi:hypothetical protein